MGALSSDDALVLFGITEYDVASGRQRLGDLVGALDSLGEALGGAGFAEVRIGPVTRPHVAAALGELRGHLVGAIGRDPPAMQRVFVYWCGHGEPDAEFVLATTDTPARSPLPLNSEQAVLPSWLAGQLASLPATELVVVLDTCESERGAAELHLAALSHRTKGVRWPPTAIVYSARRQERAEAGAFAKVIVEILEKGCLREIVGDANLDLVELWSDQHEHIRLDDAVRVATAALHTRGSSQTPGWETPNQPTMSFLRNPRFGRIASGTLDVEQLLTLRRSGDVEHFLGKASGVERIGGGWFFTGRVQPLRRLATWLGASTPGTTVVTGPAGSGKSALLGWMALLAEDGFRDAHPDIAAPATGHLLVPPRLDSVVWASNKTVRVITGQLAEDLSIAIPDDEPDPVNTTIREIGRRHLTRVVVDAVDEATEPDVLVRRLLVPLQQLGTVSLVVGVRHGTVLDDLVGALGLGGEQVVDLADDPGQAADLLHYVQRRFAAAGRADSLPFATDVREHADRFLTARLLVNALLDDPATYSPGSARWNRLVTGEAADDDPTLTDGERKLVAAFAADLGRFADRDRVDDLLRPLAWARGAGLPRRQVWAALASALSGDRLPYDDADVGWALDELGRHITIAGSDGRSVYRLYHQSYSDLYRRELQRAWRGDAPRVAEAMIAAVLAELAGERGWAAADPYAVRHLLEHAEAGNVLDQHVGVLADIHFLAAVVESFGPAVLISMLDRVIAATVAADAGERSGLIRLRQTLRLARHILVGDPGQLRAQLLARLEAGRSTLVDRLLDGIAAEATPGLEPLGASFWRAGGPIVSTIDAHRAPVTAIALLPDGVSAATASADGTVKIWDLQQERERVVLVQGQAPVLSLDVADDAGVLVAGLEDGTIMSWDIHTGTLRDRWVAASSGCRAVVTSADGRWVLTGAGERQVAVWDTGRSEQVGSTALSDASPNNMVLSDDATRLLVGGTYDSVVVVDLRLPEGTSRHVLSHRYDSWISAIAMTPDGRLGASGDWDGQIFVWDLDTGERRCRLIGHDYNEKITALTLSRDGHWLLAASGRGAISRYDLRDGADIRPVRRLATGTHRVTHLALTAHGDRAISCGDDATLHVWDLTSAGDTGLHSSGRPFDDDDDDDRLRLVVPPRPVTPRSSVLGSAGDLAELSVAMPSRPAEPADRAALPIVLTDLEREPPERWWRVARPDSDDLIFIAQDRIEHAVASADGNLLVCFGVADIAVWDLRAPAAPRTVVPVLAEPGWRWVTEAVLAADGRTVAFLTKDATVQLVDIEAGTPPRVLCTGAVGALWSDAAATVVAARSERELQVWDLRSGERVGRTAIPAGSSAAVVGDGLYWLTAAGSLGRYDLAGRRRRRSIAAFGDGAVIEPGGHFACAPAPGGVTVWDLRSGRPVVTIPAAGVTACAYSPDAGRGVVATVGPALTVWDVAGAQPFGRVTGDVPFAGCSFEDGGDVVCADAVMGGRHRFAVRPPSADGER